MTAEVKKFSKNEKLDCAKGEAIAKRLGIPMTEVGIAADLIEVKISKCQLGLFGHGKVKGKSRLVEPAEEITTAMKEAIEKHLKNDKLSCADSWKIAKALGVSRMDVCSAIEAMKKKNSNCQLGVF